MAPYDVFLCYVWEDRVLAIRLQDELRRRGLRVFRDESGMHDHDHIDTEIGAALAAARTLVALYTPAFPASEYCRQELHFSLLASRRLHRSRARTLVVLSGVDPGEVRPPRLKAWRLASRHQPLEETADAIERQVRRVTEADPRLFGDAPEPAAPLTPRLQGRELELWDLREALLPEGAVAALTGIAGQGKTMLARAVLREFAADFPGGVHVVDDVPAGLPDDQFDALLAPERRTLLISRADPGARVDPACHVALGPLTPFASLALLTSRWPAGSREHGEARLARLRADRHEYRAAAGIAEAVDGYPLALALAAGLAGRPDFTSFAELRERLAKEDDVALALRQDLRTRLATRHDGAIASALLTAIRALSPAGKEFLRFASLLAHAPIPRSLVSAVLPDAPLDEVAAANLLDAGDSVPPLVLRTLRFTETAVAEREILRERTLAAMAEQLLRAGDHTEVTGLLPHVRRLLGELADADEWQLVNEAARVHAELGDSTAVLELSGKLYDACREALGEEHETTIAALVGLGVGHGLHGDHETALRHKEKAYHLLRHRHGDEHSATITALGNIAVTHLDRGDAERAQAITGQVYRARRQHELFDAKTAEALMNHAIAVGRSGRFRLSARLRRLSYALSLRVHGESHPRTLDALNTMAVGELDLGHVGTARALFTRLAEARRRVLGEQADTAAALENLAAVSDDPAELLGEAYLIRVTALGPEHRSTQATLRSLLLAQAPKDAAGDAAEALGEPVDVPPTADVRLDDERMDERIELHRLALLCYDETLEASGPDAEETMLAVARLAHAHALLDQMDTQFDEAWTLIDDACEGLRLTRGADAPATVAAERIRTWIGGLG